VAELELELSIQASSGYAGGFLNCVPNRTSSERKGMLGSLTHTQIRETTILLLLWIKIFNIKERVLVLNKTS
jgi:hypothetical protein